MGSSNSIAPSPPAPRLLELTRCVVDLDRALVHSRDASEEAEPVSLTTREQALLLYLVERTPEPVSRDELLSQVFGFSDHTVSRACDNTVRRLREKIEVDPSRPDHLLTVHGTGYRLSLGEPVLPAVAPVAAAPVRVDLVLGDVTVDLGRQRVYGPQGEIPLTTTEAQLLARLLAAGGEVVDRLTLVREVWKQGAVRGREVDNAIRRLRAKIEPDPKEPTYLLTAIRGGYQLVLRQTSSGRPAGGRLPAPRDKFVGREREQKLLEGWLAARRPGEGPRAVAVQGPAGVGKSRLAAEVLHTLAPSLPGGAWAVDLSACRSEAEVCAAMAAALGLQGGDGGRIGRVLGARGPALVLLDNADLAADSLGPLVEIWLAASPEPRFLLTSQLRLELGAGVERLVLGPLPVEEGCQLLEARGVRLLGAPPEEARAAAQLVEALDGLPLALELAAARARVLTLQGLLSRLLALSAQDLSRFRLLGDPPRGGLLASLEASFALLSPSEREAAARLTIFAGSFSLEAALAVLGAGEEEDGSLGALERMEALVDHSLVARDGQRFFMLSSLRALAARSLTDALTDQVSRAHGAFFAQLGDPALLERAERRDGRAERDRLQRELPDLYAAAERALARGDLDVASACTLAIGRASRNEPSPTRAVALAEAVLARSPVPREPELALTLAMLLTPWVSPEPARRWAERAIALAAEQGDGPQGWLSGRAIRAKGVVVAQLDGFREAAPLFEAALEQARAAGDRLNEGAALANLGLVAASPEEKIRYQTEALEVLLACDPRVALGGQANLAQHLAKALRIDEAREMHTRVRMTALGSGLVSIAIQASNNLAQLELIFGSARAAETGYREALAVARDHGVLEAQFSAWQGLSALWASQGRLLAAEEAMSAALDAIQGRTDSLSASFWYDLSVLRRLQRRFAEAGQCIERLEPLDAALAGYARAELLAGQGQEEALVALPAAASQCLQQHPINAWFAWGRLAMLQALRGEIPAALQTIAQIEADPRHARVSELPGPGSLRVDRILLRGHLARSQGDRAGAERAYQEAQAFIELRELERQSTSAEHLAWLQFVEALRG